MTSKAHLPPKVPKAGLCHNRSYARYRELPGSSDVAADQSSSSRHPGHCITCSWVRPWHLRLRRCVGDRRQPVGHRGELGHGLRAELIDLPTLGISKTPAGDLAVICIILR